MNKRKAFLMQMIFEISKVYKTPGEKWTLDEIALLLCFLSKLKRRSLLLDLAGGYGRVSRIFLDHGHNVVLLDLSIN